MTSMASSNSCSPIQQFVEQEQTYCFNIIREHGSLSGCLVKLEKTKKHLGRTRPIQYKQTCLGSPNCEREQIFFQDFERVPALDLTRTSASLFPFKSIATVDTMP
ncbi:hypothetical protein CEXT_182571 [Caerostris extrusa]|uniref:Uncharacterized protein n=1 Tax=Caerostris extrusa TaxID=172846 RepID=A0AAV4MX08_CAEEX|nr:hypothetical protein CEXT_182571 [Caerostris extrusa]